MGSALLTRPSNSRTGGIYIAVLGTAMLVSLIGLAALAATRVQRAATTATMDSAKARLYAQSAVQLAMQAMKSDAAWRNNRASGVWVANKAIDDGWYSIEVIDPVDGNFANRPSDPVVVRGTGRRAQALQMMEVTLNARGDPIDALKMAVHTAGEFWIETGRTLTAQGAPASTNGALRNEGTIAGDAQCTAVTSLGTITGTFTMPAPMKAMPSPDPLPLYNSLGTVITPGSLMSKVVLAAGLNPWGPPNPEGVYVINLAGDLTITQSRINGTLVINGAGRTVTFDGALFMHPHRPDYPVLVTDANVEFLYDSGATQLSEAAQAVTFNPAGAPYLGVSDTDQTDTYPSEIRGLVHVQGALGLGRTGIVRGIVLGGSTGSNAIRVAGAFTVVHDPALFAAPPMGYTRATTMSPAPGSWTQVVNP